MLVGCLVLELSFNMEYRLENRYSYTSERREESEGGSESEWVSEQAKKRMIILRLGGFLIFAPRHNERANVRDSCQRQRYCHRCRDRPTDSTRRDGVTLAQLVLCRIKVIRIR